MMHPFSGLRHIAVTAGLAVLTLVPSTTIFAQSEPCKGVSDRGTAYSNLTLFAQRRAEWLACIDSFGPNMSLAKDLLEAGETHAVIASFEQCRTFWKMDGTQLDRWTADVRDGKVPNFGANLRY